MSREVIARRGRPTLRGVAVWSTLTLVAGGLPALLRAELATVLALVEGEPAGLAFETLLVSTSAVALCACGAWAWLATTATLLLVTTGRAHRVPGCPEVVRRLVLAACGLTVVVTAVPAHADPAGGPPTPEPAERAATALLRPAPAELVVRPGDSLWALAEAWLPPTATDAEIDRAWRRLWAANREAIGPDPDLILPGSQLRRPTPKEHR